MSGSSRPFGPRTRAIHAGARRSQYAEMAEALFMTQGFKYDSAEQAEARFQDSGPDEFIYARYGNPTTRVFEDRMAAIEGTEDAFATASGMAAVQGALFSMLKPGDKVVSARALFGSCLYVLEYLAGFGVEVIYVDGTDNTAWEKAIDGNTEVVFFESVSNPTLEVVDMSAVAAMAHKYGAKLVVDNVFATPVFSRAAEMGADVIIYSATKHIDGSGRALGGLICGTQDYIRNVAEPYLKHTGGAISPFNAWLMLGGLTTMDLRVRAMADSALAVAQMLASRQGVTVSYPGLPQHPQHDLAMRQMGTGGTMVAFDVEAGKDAAFKLLNNLSVISISNNLGDSRSIATHPATTTHQRLSPEDKTLLGITPGLIRLSIGLEDSTDLLADLDEAMKAAGL